MSHAGFGDQEKHGGSSCDIQCPAESDPETIPTAGQSERRSSDREFWVHAYLSGRVHID